MRYLIHITYSTTVGMVGAAEDLPDDAGEGLLELMVGHHIDYGV